MVRCGRGLLQVQLNTRGASFSSPARGRWKSRVLELGIGRKVQPSMEHAPIGRPPQRAHTHNPRRGEAHRRGNGLVRRARNLVGTTGAMVRQIQSRSADPLRRSPPPSLRERRWPQSAEQERRSVLADVTVSLCRCTNEPVTICRVSASKARSPRKRGSRRYRAGDGQRAVERPAQAWPRP